MVYNELIIRFIVSMWNPSNPTKMAYRQVYTQTGFCIYIFWICGYMATFIFMQGIKTTCLRAHNA